MSYVLLRKYSHTFVLLTHNNILITFNMHINIIWLFRFVSHMSARFVTIHIFFRSSLSFILQHVGVIFNHNKWHHFCKQIVLYYTIWQHCSTTPMRQAIHSKATDCAWCILPNNYESCRITNVRNNIDKILPIVCNVFFIERFTLSLDPILIVFLKLAVSRQKSGWPAPPEMKVGY